MRQGQDVTLAATGGILGEALRAADLLPYEGIEARVLSVHTIKPLDAEYPVRPRHATPAGSSPSRNTRSPAG